MDGRPNSRNKAAFSNVFSEVWTRPLSVHSNWMFSLLGLGNVAVQCSSVDLQFGHCSSATANPNLFGQVVKIRSRFEKFWFSFFPIQNEIIPLR